MLSRKWLDASPLTALVLCAAFAGLPACAADETSDANGSSAAAATQDTDETPEDVASLDADAADPLIAKAVFGVSKLRDENGNKRVFAHVRYYDKNGSLLAYGIPNAKDAKGNVELAIVRVEPGSTNLANVGLVHPQSGPTDARAKDDARLTDEARALTAKLVTDVDAKGCSLGKGVLRAVGRFIGGLVVGTVGLVIAVALSPVYLVILIGGAEEGDSAFVNTTAKPFETGINLLKGSFKPCRELPSSKG